MLLITILTPALFVLLFISWASFPWSIKGHKEAGTIVDLGTYQLDEELSPSILKMITWNTGFFYGEGSEGDGYEAQDEAFYSERLVLAANELKSWDADIVFLQEIDFASSRTHFINQAITLAKLAGYHFVAQAPSWKANYIPFPYWPVSLHFGRMNSGGAILSRYPLKNHQIHILDKPASNPWWYNLFYLHRYLQQVNVTVGEKSFHLVNLHLEAFDKANRENQIQELIKLHKTEEIDFIAGDFNMVPDAATQKSKFINGDDYTGDLSFRLMGESGLDEVIPMDIYEKSEKDYFTFPSSKPDRRLDYIFYQRGLKLMKAEVLSSALSDHLPLSAIFQINSPKVNPYSL